MISAKQVKISTIIVAMLAVVFMAVGCKTPRSRKPMMKISRQTDLRTEMLAEIAREFPVQKGLYPDIHLGIFTRMGSIVGYGGLGILREMPQVEHEIIKRIKDEVEPESWSKKGTWLSLKKNCLIVHQEKEVIRKIHKFIEKERESIMSKDMITTEVRVLSIPEGLEKNFLKDYTAGIPVAGTKDVYLMIQPVTPEVLQDTDAKILCSTRVTTFDDQRSYMTSIMQHAYIQDYYLTFVDGKELADPVIGIYNTGIILQVRPTLQQGGKSIMVDLLIQYAQTKSWKELKTEYGPIELPETLITQLKRKLTIEGKSAVLITGPVVKGRKLLFVVKASICEKS